LLCDVIGHKNQSQHYSDHRYLCLELSGRIIMPDGFSYHTGFSTLRTVFEARVLFCYQSMVALLRIVKAER